MSRRLTPLAAALCAALAVALATQARAQTGCAAADAACAAECARLCPGDAASCLSACETSAVCRAAEERCADGAEDAARDAPLAAAPAPQFAPPQDPSLQARILFLVDRREPEAAYYGYLAIGAEVDDARRRAVARALGCAVETYGAGAVAAAELALIAIPATASGPSPTAAGAATSPDAILALYDAVRGQRWLRAAGYALDDAFDPDRAIVFIGSRRPRAAQLDTVALPAPNVDVDPTDPVIADASGLEPSGLEAWVSALVHGVRSGAVRSRQDYQSWMEAYAWIEWASSPVTGLFTITQASAAPGIACP